MLDARIDAKRLPRGDLLLRDVRLTADAGDIVALLGASGTGKTTTLRILLGLDRDYDGAVRTSAVRAAAVFQEPRLLPWRTVAENVSFVVNGAMPQPDVGQLLRAVGLGGIAADYPRQLSLGMARRVAVARAMAIVPDLLVLDEPFASLDPQTTGLLADLLASHVRAHGAAVIVAMHDLARAAAFATRIIVLAGRPATIARRLDIAPGASSAERSSLQAALLQSFPFLDGARGSGECTGTLSNASIPV